MRYINHFIVKISIVAVFLLISNSFSQQKARIGQIFHKATIKMDKSNLAPVEIGFSPDQRIPLSAFWLAYSDQFNLSAYNEFKNFKSITDRLGQTHFRYKQYYKGIEIADVQYILHEQNGMVYLANGRIVHNLNLEIVPTLSESKALYRALEQLDAESFMWENKNNEAFIKSAKNNINASFYPKGQLMISSPAGERTAGSYRLVYRFDIWIEKPFQGYFVDVDAHTGEIINKVSLIHTGDVPGEGQSLYNGIVQLTVSDSDYPAIPVPVAHGHVSGWNAYNAEGMSFWIADSTLGTDGGYDNSWYEVLDTDTIRLNGDNPQLTFYHRYNVEEPETYNQYDGWDGMNVRISNNNGASWVILEYPSPAYTSSSLYSFGSTHNEGSGVPGWAGQHNEWSQVTFDLSSYANQTVQIRFAFASDEGLSTAEFLSESYGWQIDEIVIRNSGDTLYFNDGDTTSATFKNLFREVNEIAGNYRLREAARGGIFTYDARSGGIGQSIDFLDNDSSFTKTNDQAGVSTHWAMENTYDYFLSVFNRNGYDDQGSRIICYVHYLTEFVNAFWAGFYMVFGDGNGIDYGPLVTLDVVGHEYTHGVTQESANLIYQSEYGALNESFSDIFGEAIERFTVGTNDWLMGDDFALNGISFRSMIDPNSRLNPDTYEGNYWFDPYDLEIDAGGVHINSSVQNHWFYLLVEGGSGVNDYGFSYDVTGIGFADAEQIAYRNLAMYLTPTSEYLDARLGSVNAATDLFGAGSAQVQAVREAWNAVGVYPAWAVKVQSAALNASYYAPGSDSLFIAAVLTNSDQIGFEARVMIENFSRSTADTLPLFDDGSHNDSLAHDGIYSLKWPAPQEEDFYNVHISVSNADSGYYYQLYNVSSFTTVGPLTLTNVAITSTDTIPRPGKRLKFEFTLTNSGTTTIAGNISSQIASLDTFAELPISVIPFYGDIAPGQMATGNLSQYIKFNSDIPDSVYTRFSIDIMSSDYVFWSDTFEVFVHKDPTAIDNSESLLPTAYILRQNRPNPFNPATKISFTLPKQEHVTLVIYNTLGQKVATLLNTKMNAGSHDVQFNAGTLPTAIYFYRIHAGEFSQVKKMVLLR